ncbi:MAG: ATP-binding cassette domain-containing protein [Bacilli bacterium]|nr:ATP-binding cassette domain-containing protein [Bacilli bacterium]
METVLKTNNLTKVYGRRTVVDGVSMTINKGDIYGFIGKNGAGKTTFMRTVLSLTSITSGGLELFGGKKIEEVGNKIGSLIEAPGLYKNATAYENLKRFSILFGADESKINDILKFVNLDKTGKKKAKDFSLGMRQRLGIAIALLGDPEFLVLDEPINGLDPAGIKEIRDVILKLNKELGITFLISSHLLDELAKVVTKYGIINNGVLLEEVSAKELINNCKNKLIIETDDNEKAKELIKSEFDIKKIDSIEDKLVLYSDLEKSALINKALVKKGILVSEIYTEVDSLEEYFIRKIGDTNE